MQNFLGEKIFSVEYFFKIFIYSFIISILIFFYINKYAVNQLSYLGSVVDNITLFVIAIPFCYFTDLLS